MKKKRWLSILLSLSLLLMLLPAQAFGEEGTDGTESTCTQTADCPAEVHEPDCPLWQEDSTGPEETGTSGTKSDGTGMDETGTGSTKPGGTVPDETEAEETGPGETSPEKPAEPGEPEETQPTAAEVLALIAALPDPGGSRRRTPKRQKPSSKSCWPCTRLWTPTGRRKWATPSSRPSS